MHVMHLSNHVAMICVVTNKITPGWILGCGEYSWFWVNIWENFLTVFSVCPETQGYLHIL